MCLCVSVCIMAETNIQLVNLYVYSLGYTSIRIPRERFYGKLVCSNCSDIDSFSIQTSQTLNFIFVSALVCMFCARVCLCAYVRVCACMCVCVCVCVCVCACMCVNKLHCFSIRYWIFYHDSGFSCYHHVICLQ